MISVMLESAARTLFLALAASIALRLLRVRHVVAQKIAWTLVLAAAVAMPFLMRWHLVQLPSIALPTSWTQPARHSVPAAHRTVILTQAQSSEPETADISVAPTVLQIVPNTTTTGPVRRWTLPPLRTQIVIAYFAVAGFLLLRLLFGLVLAWRIWNRAERASALVDPRADVRFSSDIRTPVTIGLGIVIPDSFREWSRSKLRIVLAHELAHVRQADFYLQLIARLHTAVFWFNPAAWWMQKQLSDLGEAISDFAGIAEAQDAPTYAEVLLEVAAIPRQPLFAVAMARSSRIERRIDRLLIDRLFRRSFVEGRRRGLAVALVIPVVLAASASLVAVRAAERVAPAPSPLMHLVATQDNGASVTIPEMPAPKVPVAPLPNVKLAALETPEPPAPSPRAQANPSPAAADRDPDIDYSDSNQDSYMIVNGDKSEMFNYHGDYAAMEAIRKKMHGNYILAERSGKYYVIDDPAMMDQTRKLFAPIDELGRQQEALGAQQEKLGEEQEKLGRTQEQAHIATPDMSKEVAELQDAVKKLQDLEKSKTVTQDQLAEVQSHIAGIEGKLGAMQGQIGSQQGELGRQQGELGRKQGELGRQQGELGRQQGRLARQANRQMKSMIDQAFQSGKAKPVE